MKPDSISTDASSRLWHPYTRRSSLEEEPLPVIVRGEGPYLFDSAGHRYVDAISSWWAVNLGHSHPRIVEAIVRQSRELQHSILGNLSHPRAIELAERLAALFPSPSRRILFASDGSSAVEAALKIALQYAHNIGRPERARIASLRLAYHGDTLGAVSAGFLKAFHAPFAHVIPAPLQAEAPCPGVRRYGLAAHACGAGCVASVRELIESHAHEMAALIVEPLCLAAGGMRMYSSAALRELAGLCRRHGVLLIVDEIAMGFGRAGTMWAFEQAGIDPDIVCLGKGLSGGTLPISATVVREEIYDTFGDTPVDRTFYHGHTFAGNPIAAAAALAALDVYAREGVLEGVRERSGDLRGGLESFAGLRGVVDRRCLGMIAAIEFEGDARAVRRHLRQHGVLARPLGNVVYLMPPLNTPRDVLSDTLGIVHDAISAQS